MDDKRVDKIEAMLQEVLNRQTDIELLITEKINAEQEASVRKFQCNKSQPGRPEIGNNSYQFGIGAHQAAIP